MRLSLWKPISQCAALIKDKNRRHSSSDQPSLHPCGDDTAGALFPGDHIPSLDDSMQQFLATYPRYRSTDSVDRLRSAEYPHIDGQRICLDYCGFGLFSFLQTLQPGGGAAFSLTEVSANLGNHVLHGGAEPGTAEHDVRTRVMEYLNVPESEYGLVFTASRGAAFKLLADRYPFQGNRGLLTVFDHESQAVDWMAQAARDRGARVRSAGFRWPTMKLCAGELRRRIRAGRRRGGLFVFPSQSRVTGAKYSYQWMALAQQNKWHVLLDAGALGPKDMASLGLSLFRPDFIITSFYRVFGHDPSGFGCLLIKKTAVKALKSGPATMVRVVVDHPQYLSDGEAAFSGAFHGEDLGKSPVFSEPGSSENSLWPSPWAAPPITPPLDAIKPEGGAAVITRETECEFRLLGIREGKTAPISDNDDDDNDDNDDDDGDREREIVCRHLDHVDEVGLNKTTMRLRYLINWLVNSLLLLRLDKGRLLVQVYGPDTKYERGPAVAFNVLDGDGKRVNPEVVQRLAEKEGILLGIGLMSYIKVAEEKKGGVVGRVAVVTVSLGFLSNFEDVYKVWAFVAKFLDLDFVKGDSGVAMETLTAVAEGVEVGDESMVAGG